MSYFKYAERSSESRVDWNEISKGMVDMLKEQTRLRNEKLDEAVKLQGEVTTTLSEAPMGSDVNANQRVSEFAADAQEYSLMMNKLWRSGEMSYREYMAATNNFKTNTEGYLSQAEKYAANYEKHVKRMEEQIASGVEVSELARVEDFGNFSKFTPVIDAPTGSIGLVGEDGTKYASVTQLGVAVMSQYDRLDVEGRTTDVAKQMGTTVEVLKAGDVRTLESALQNADYVDAEDDAVSGILIGDNAHTSVLVDFKRGLYSTTHDINDAINDPNAILMVPSSRNSDRMIGAVEDDAAFERYIDEQATRDGQPLTDGEKAILRKNRDAQREQSFEAVRDQLRARLPFVETPTAERTPGGGTGPTDAETKRQGVIDRTRTAAGHWMNLAFALTPEQKTTSARALQGLKFEDEYGSRQTIVGVDPKTFEDRVVLTLRDANGNETTVDRVYADSPDAEQWVSQGNFFYEDPSIAEALVSAAQSREEGPLYGAMTLGVRASGAALAKEVVDIIPFEQATIGTGKSAASVPVYFSENAKPGNAESEAAATTSAVKAALGAMGVDASSVTHITEAASEDAGVDLDWDTEKETIRFHIPGVTPQSIFVPNNQAGINALADMMAMLPDLIKNRGQLTVEEALEKFSNVPKFKDYNGEKFGDTMREKFGITEAARPTSAGGGAGSASALYNTGG
jgi:hypothetical protein